MISEKRGWNTGKTEQSPDTTSPKSYLYILGAFTHLNRLFKNITRDQKTKPPSHLHLNMNYFNQANVRTLDRCPPKLEGLASDQSRRKERQFQCGQPPVGGPSPSDPRQESAVHACPRINTASLPFPQFSHFPLRRPLPSTSPTSSLLQQRHWHDPVTKAWPSTSWGRGSGTQALGICFSPCGLLGSTVSKFYR